MIKDVKIQYKILEKWIKKRSENFYHFLGRRIMV